MVGREDLLKFIRITGPVLPVQIAKEVNTSILFASAMLSELVSSKIIKVSSVKIGGSPLYYLPEHNSRLQEFSKHLHPKEKEAYELLRQNKVLRDAEQLPPIRVALANIKDYAWPLHVTIDDNKELFWKWYLSSNDEAEVIIKKSLGITEQKQEQKKPTEEKERHTEKKAEPKEKMPEQRQKLSEQTSLPEAKKEPKPAKEMPKDEFFEQLSGYFSRKSIKILNHEIIKGKKEIDFVVELQSNVGSIKCYCKAKSKKTVNGGDLSLAYVIGQVKKLPVLFLSQGEPTKKAKEMLANEFSSMIFKNIQGE